MSDSNVYDVVKGLSENTGLYIGRVAEQPWIEGDAAIVKLNTVAAEMDVNGQLVDRVQVVPITVLDKKKVAGIKQYVQKGKQLLVNAYYKSWVDNGEERHALVATKIKYGPSAFNPNQKRSSGGGGGINIPPGV